MNKERLLRLADFLEEKVPEKRFSMWTYIYHEIGDDPTLSLSTRCKTTACAAGWASIIPEFKKAGFGLEQESPAFEDERNEEALQAFFDLTPAQSAIFYTSQCTPKQFAARLRHLVKTGKCRTNW